MSNTTISRAMPTVSEVARRAQVSRATVYAVLNAEKKTNIGVSKENKQRVIEVARELGYVRNETARALVSGKTCTLGVIVGTLKTGFFADFFSSLDDACSQNGYSVIIATSENDKDREARNLRTMLAKRVDAIIIARTHPEYNSDLLDLFLKRGIPVVIIGEDDITSEKYYQVAFCEKHISRIIADYLWELGHRKVSYFSIQNEKDLTSRLHKMRYDNFSECWQELGGTAHGFTTADVTHGGKELVDQMLKSRHESTAIVCSCDTLAISSMHSLHTREIKIPGDISIVGCDDIEIASELLIPLTTVRLPRNKLGQSTWKILQARLLGAKEGAKKSTQILVEPELVIRKSTRNI